MSEDLRLPDGQTVIPYLMLRDTSAALAFYAAAFGAGALVFAYTPDVDALSARAEAAGAVIMRPLTDQFWGDRTVTLRDPFGHVWTFATRKERMTLEEAKARASFGADPA